MRIVALGLHIPGTGFTRVFETLFRYLGQSFDIHWIGIAYKGPEKQCDGYRLYPNNLRGGDMFGTYGSVELATALEADLVLFLNDTWILRNYAEAHRGQPWHTMAYIPLDGNITGSDDVRELTFLDSVVAYHETAAQDFRQAFSIFNQTDEQTPQVLAIYHGVDTGAFSLPEDAWTNALWRKPFQSLFFSQIQDWEDSIFILNANRFNERKDIRTTLEGFALALPDIGDPAYLCLHMPAIEPFQQDILEQWIAEFNLADHVLINPASGQGYADEHTLAALYKACEIGINTSLGEGWGLVSFEHAACGAAQIVPSHGGQPEIWGDNADFLSATEHIKLANNPFMMQKSSPESLATHLVKLCNDKDWRRQRGKAAFHHVRGDRFKWPVIAGQWKALIEYRVGSGQ